MPEEQEETRTGPGDRARRLRFDEDRIARAARPNGAVPTSRWLPRDHSGRRFVSVAIVIALLVFTALYLVFRDWRARYRARAAFGATRVVPTIGPMAAIVPPGVSPDEWRDAVARTRELLETITGSNVLGLKEMRSLRDELEKTVERARARPETAAVELAGIWDEMGERGGFLLVDEEDGGKERLARPVVLPSYAEDRVVPALDGFRNIAPPNIASDAWLDAVTRTKARWLAVLNTASPGILRMQALRRDLDRSADRASARPETATEELARLWDAVPNVLEKEAAGKTGASSVNDRPAVLPKSQRSARQR